MTQCNTDNDEVMGSYQDHDTVCRKEMPELTNVLVSLGKGLCLVGDMLTPNGRLVKCISPAPLSEVCSAEGLDNVTW